MVQSGKLTDELSVDVNQQGQSAHKMVSPEAKSAPETPFITVTPGENAPKKGGPSTEPKQKSPTPSSKSKDSEKGKKSKWWPFK